MKPLDPQRFQYAVTTLALGAAKYRVLDQLRADGKKPSHYSCAEINALREVFFANHLDELMAQALTDV
jgi:hypothetical protein